MSHFYTGHHVHSTRAASYQRSLPAFDLNSRVKLPPIIRNELLTGRDKKSTPQQAPTCPSDSTSVSFPRIIETQTPRKWNQNGTNPQQIRSAKKQTANKTITHVEKSPIRFPNSYAVLPPIGQTRSWPYSGFSSLQTTPRNGEQAPINIPDQVQARRRRSSQRKSSENIGSPASPARNFQGNETIKSLSATTKNAQTNSSAVENISQKDLFLPRSAANRLKLTDDQVDASSETAIPTLASEDVEITDCDPIHELEKLELSKEVEEFLESKNSQRRGGKCIEIDPSLKTAVDVIRDNLLRQTMEELCMMW